MRVIFDQGKSVIIINDFFLFILYISRMHISCVGHQQQENVMNIMKFIHLIHLHARAHIINKAPSLLFL